MQILFLNEDRKNNQKICFRQNSYHAEFSINDYKSFKPSEIGLKFR